MVVNVTACLIQSVRRFRTRVRDSRSNIANFVVDNRRAVNPVPVGSSESSSPFGDPRNTSNDVSKFSWPPLLSKEESVRITKPYCRKLLREIELGEIIRLKKARSFVMPRVALGDLVQVRYELSRSQQTFTIFEGYCISIAKKGINASFSLKNSYDGIAVEQLFPFHSPRLLDVRILKKANPTLTRSQRRLRLTNRNYRYKWQNYVRHLYSEGFRVRWRQIRQHPGVMSLEPRIKRELANLRRQYAMMRQEAGLPAYVWPGPYQIHMRQSREVNAERMRRMLVYAWDAKRQENAKRRLKRNRWGRDQIAKPNGIIDDLPRGHLLSPGNLPK